MPRRCGVEALRRSACRQCLESAVDALPAAVDGPHAATVRACLRRTLVGAPQSPAAERRAMASPMPCLVPLTYVDPTGRAIDHARACRARDDDGDDGNDGDDGDDETEALQAISALHAALRGTDALRSGTGAPPFAPCAPRHA